MRLTYIMNDLNAKFPSIFYLLLISIIYMKKQVYTYQKQIAENTPFGPIVVSVSKYADCILLLINQTGAIGSIIEGTASQSTAQLAYEEDFQVQAQGRSNFIYNIRVLFGSTQIEFYELLLRRVMGLLWEQLQVPNAGKIIMNISLPVLKEEFNNEQYYGLLVEECRNGLKSVI